jgi:phenylacetate-CoA ligase
VGSAGRICAQTRDLTRLLPGTAHTMRRIEKVGGRSDDMIILRGVNVFPTQLEAVILGDRRLAPHFVIELRREGRLDSMALKVEARADAAGEESRAASAADLVHRIKSLVGITVAVETVLPGTIERSIGKAKRIIDMRGK